MIVLSLLDFTRANISTSSPFASLRNIRYAEDLASCSEKIAINVDTVFIFVVLANYLWYSLMESLFNSFKSVVNFETKS